MLLMVTGSILTGVDIGMKGNGRIICKMEEEKQSIVMRVDIMANF